MNIDETKEISWTPEVEGAEEATVKVTVKGIKERELPELTDEFAKTSFGFDDIAAMRDAVKIELDADKSSKLPGIKENRAVAKLAERLELEKVDEDYEQSIFSELGQNFLQSLAGRGMTLDSCSRCPTCPPTPSWPTCTIRPTTSPASPSRSMPSLASSRSRSPMRTSTLSSSALAFRTRGLQGRVPGRGPYARHPRHHPSLQGR